MSSSSAHPSMSIPRALALWALPWLCSSTAHMLLFLVLIATYQFTREEIVQPGTNAGTGLEAVFISSRDQDGMDGADPTRDAGGSQFYDDEPAPFAQEIGKTHEGGGARGSAALTALLNEKPAVNLAGVLPTAATGLGSGGLEGGGVGTAQGLTTHPRGSNRLRGGYARTGVFGVSGEGHKFVYVFDRSGSMDGHGGAPLNAAKAELISSLEHLGQTHQFQIIFYNEHPRVFNPSGVLGRLVFGTEQNKYLAQKFVGSITADGATRHDEALEMAVRLAPDVIFFLTDADEPRMTAKQLARIAEMNKGTQINTIEFGYGVQIESDNFLDKLARQNGGKHVYVDISKLPAARR
ncbi:MAG: hypothetical protein HY288_18895 [Planctomycetia bacterium]|nr:hypothetical protein [Planctomycetia bacterium]